VADYVRYRPSYPAAVLEILRNECGLRPNHAVADVGSGTGVLAKLFLENGNRVFGVEPNDGMRQAGEDLLSGFRDFCSINGSAEATTLPNASADFITAAQAFHWFEPIATRGEFLRILRPTGFLVIVWNDRQLDTTPFNCATTNRCCFVLEPTTPRSTKAIRGSRKSKTFLRRTLLRTRPFRILRSSISMVFVGGCAAVRMRQVRNTQRLRR
jgi:ubiquinone/menaquinone biosynthesis C-methylase UbiE